MKPKFVESIDQRSHEEIALATPLQMPSRTTENIGNQVLRVESSDQRIPEEIALNTPFSRVNL